MVNPLKLIVAVCTLVSTSIAVLDWRSSNDEDDEEGEEDKSLEGGIEVIDWGDCSEYDSTRSRRR